MQRFWVQIHLLSVEPKLLKMKKIIAVLAICSVWSFANAQSYLEEKPLFEHMFEVNKEWSHYKNFCPEINSKFESENERIAMHIYLVCQYLDENGKKNLNEKQFTNRKELIASLKIYGVNAEFPTNHYHTERRPYFVDNFGVHCAVGHLMHVSGNDDLVANIRRDHNYDYIRDIKTGGVAEWAIENGFTINELKWIQPGYPPQTLVEPVGGGTDNPINDMVYDDYNDQLIISGEFTMLDGATCLKIGRYDGNQLSCLGSGLNGVIEDVFIDNDGVIAVGAIQDGGNTYPMAQFDGTNWTYIEIPGRVGAIGTTGTSGEWAYDYEVVISHSSNPGNQEIWHLKDGNWILTAEINGDVYDLAKSFDYRAYVGQFDQVTIFDTLNGTYSVNVDNAILKETYADVWHEVLGDVSDTIKTAEFAGSTLYMAGNCSTDTLKSDVCLSRYLNGTVQPMILREDFFVSGNQDYTINDLEFDGGNRLLMAGYFPTTYMLTIGQNVGYYHLTGDYTSVLANPNLQANSIAYCFGAYFFGGDFLTNGMVNLNHLGRIIDYAGDDPFTNELSVYPNPFQTELAIEGMDGNAFVLKDVSGQDVRRGTVYNNRISDLDDLDAGMYLLTVQTEKGALTQQLIKQ